MIHSQNRWAMAVLLVGPLSAFAQAGTSELLPASKVAAVDAAVNAQLKRQDLVGVAIGILQEGRIVYLHGYGLADREQAIPVTQRTVFNWASNCKPLAAVAAMQLVEKGRLDLEADVRRYVPEFPEKNAVITVRHLLCHQSGIPHYANGQIIPVSRPDASDPPYTTDPIRALDRFSESPLLFRPGEEVSYSSYAYVLLSAVIQRAGDAQFQTQIDQRIASPLGLKSLQFDVEAHRADWAVGYTKSPDGRVVRAQDEANAWKFGAGGLKSNVEDFARWAQAILNHRLLSARIEKLMWTPQTTAGGKPTKWGLGFTIEDQGGLKVSHNGQQNETTTRLVLYPAKRHGVVVMCNCRYADVGAISTAVYRALSTPTAAAQVSPIPSTRTLGRPSVDARRGRRPAPSA